MDSELTDDRPFYEAPHRSKTKMSRKDLEGEVENWRNLFSWLDMEVKGWLVKSGYTFKFTRRDYQTFFGTLGKAHWELKQLELDCIVEEKDYIHRTLVSDIVTMTVGIGQLIHWEEVHNRNEIQLTDRMELPVEKPDEDEIPELV